MVATTSIIMMFSLFSILIVNLIEQSVANKMTAIVNTSTGPVQGEILTSVHSTKYASFKGIRYAEPPLGYLRFQPPVPVKPWTEVLNATVDGNDCPQYNESTSKIYGSEDCLFLNVYTPVTNLSETPTKLKTVMVWIYGGAFVSGSSATENNRPDYLIQRDVVMVSLNYRIGALGFLNLGHQNATGNAGLKDQTLALKWIQANVEKFGGNPKNVTIFGCSTGAVAIGFHVLSEQSRGLFHGAISMSGTPLVPWGFIKRAEAIERAEKLARLLGAFPWTKSHYLKSLYGATVEKLVELAFVVHMATPFEPTVEDASLTSDPFISDCTIKMYQNGNFNKVPQLLGFMDQETVAFVGYLDKFRGFVNQASELMYVMTVKRLEMLPKPQSLEIELESEDNIYGIEAEDIIDNIETEFIIDNIEAVGSIGIIKAEESLNRLRQLHPDVDGSKQWLGTANYRLLRTAINLTTDSLFKLQIDETQRLLANNIGDVPIYYYDITFDSSRSRHNIGLKHPIYGAGHADDLVYVFYFPGHNYNLSLSDPMGLTIYRVCTMWTNFAKYGDPTPSWVDQYPLNITWPPSGKSGKALEIGNELKVVPRPINANTRLLETLWKPLSHQFNDC